MGALPTGSIFYALADGVLSALPPPKHCRGFGPGVFGSVMTPTDAINELKIRGALRRLVKAKTPAGQRQAADDLAFYVGQRSESRVAEMEQKIYAGIR